MEKEKLDEILTKHKLWMADSENGMRADLWGADLWGADLRGAKLQRAELRGADLWRAKLRRANLWEANLQGANLLGADLRRANLLGADLRRADLRRAKLQRADLRRANLWGAKLQRADLLGANLRCADLRGISADFKFTCQTSSYEVVCINNHFQIGCISRDLEFFENLTEEDARKLDGERAVEFWENELPKILKMYKIAKGLNKMDEIPVQQKCSIVGKDDCFSITKADNSNDEYLFSIEKNGEIIAQRVTSEQLDCFLEYCNVFRENHKSSSDD